MISFGISNISKADEYFDPLGFGVSAGLGISRSNIVSANKDNKDNKTEDAFALAIRCSGFIQYNFINYLGIQSGCSYNMIPLKMKKEKESTYINLHNISFPLKLKIYPFGVQKGLSFGIGAEPMLKIHLSHTTINDKNRSTTVSGEKEENDTCNIFFLLGHGSIEYEIKSLGLLFSLTGGITIPKISGLFSKKGIDDMNKLSKERGSKKEFANPIFGYLTFNIGYNFANLLF